MLFDQNPRGLGEKKPLSMPWFQYLNSSTLPSANIVRMTWETFFSNIGNSRKGELRGRFRSLRDQDHIAACFELYLHELMIRSGYEVTSCERPDFLVTNDSGDRFYLEACCVFPGFESGPTDLHKHSIVARINREIRSASIQLSARFLSSGTGPVFSIRKHISHLRNLVIAWEEQFVRGSVFCPAKGQVRLGSLTLEIEPRTRTTGVGSALIPMWNLNGTAILDTTREHLRKVLKKKANKYDANTRPLIIAVNVIGRLGLDDDDLYDALFGNQTFTYDLENGLLSNCVPGRALEGFWTHGAKRQNTRVQAVIVTTNLGPVDLPPSSSRIIWNPFGSSQNSLARNPYFAQYLYDETANTYQVTPAIDQHGLFGLDETWPNLSNP